MQRSKCKDDDEAGKKEDTVGVASISALRSILPFLILYIRRQSNIVKSSIIRIPTNPTGTVNSHTSSHSSAVHSVF